MCLLSSAHEQHHQNILMVLGLFSISDLLMAIIVHVAKANLKQLATHMYMLTIKPIIVTNYIF